MGLFNFFGSGTKKPSIDLTDYKFVSDNHERTQNGQKSNANNKGAWRGIRIQSSDNLTFTVTMYNLIGNHPVWGDNIQMAPKPMRLIEENGEKIFLRGFGTDAMGGSFADYGTTLHKQNGRIEKITLHMFDRNVEILYFEGNSDETNKAKEFSQTEETTKSEQNLDDKIIAFKNFKQKWDTEFSPIQQGLIATHTDNLNKKGADYYNEGNTDLAIEYFNQAIQAMPINDSALLNLAICYNKKQEYMEAIESLRIIHYIYPNQINRNKSIAYSLLLKLIDNYKGDIGVVSTEVLLDFIKDKFQINTTSNEITKILGLINQHCGGYILRWYEGGSLGIGSLRFATCEEIGTYDLKCAIRSVLNWN